MLICHLCIFFGEIPAKVLAYFLNKFLFSYGCVFKGSLCILDNSPFFKDFFDVNHF